MSVNAKKIKGDIRSQLIWDDRVNAADIHIEVNPAGWVKLTGTVPGYNARRAAQQDAWMIAGVSAVDNELTVHYPKEIILPSDSELVEMVQSRLKWDSSIDESHIEVRVDNGEVMLEGSVPAYWKKTDAEDLALGVKGVLGVKNHLTVVPTEKASDREIAKDIETALERSLNVDAGPVNVKVENGEVTLSGKVASGTAFRAAYEISLYTTGVTEVDNQLIIER
jgi:osmotically-inducible protein OsmY